MIKSVSFSNRGVIYDNKFIVSDIHLGYHNNIDSLTPTDELNQVINRIENVANNENINEIVFAGDTFDEFGIPNPSTIEIFYKIKDYINNEDIVLTVLEGNHDKNTHKSLDVDFKEEIVLDNITVTHGHKYPLNESKNYIIGHIHPTVKIEGVTWPAYLYGDSIYKGSNVIVLPSFNHLKSGSVISKNTNLNVETPILQKADFGKLQPIVFDEDNNSVKKFPKLEESDRFFGI